MSFVASTVATVPVSGFDWYVVFLEGPFADEMRKEIDAHFNTFGREAGANVLAVRGYEPTAFRESVYEAAAFYDPDWKERADFPALLVTNVSPSLALSDAEKLKEAKVMLFPLGGIYQERRTITEFLTDLLKALRSEDTLKSLEKLDKSSLKKGWGWLRRYVEMKPGFFGFNVNLNEVLNDAIRA